MKKNILISFALASLTQAGCTKTEDGSASASSEISEAAEPESVADEMNEPQTAYAEANTKMHKGMGVIDVDPDVAFMQGMVPHHQGAVDMAEIVLKYGKDPEARALAQTIIESQTKEIAQMNAWLAKRDIEPADTSKVDHGAMGPLSILITTKVTEIENAEASFDISNHFFTLANRSFVVDPPTETENQLHVRY